MKQYKINRKVYEVSDEKFDFNTKTQMNTGVTLREVKGMVGSTRKYKKAPRANYLRCCGTLVAAVTTPGCRLEVYSDGFAVYQTVNHLAVIRMECVGKVWYEGDPELERGTQSIDLTDECWTVAVMMSGEDRLERWSRMRDEDTLVYLCVAGEVDDETGENTELELDAGVDIEDNLLSEEERAVLWTRVSSILTKRQSEVIELFYRECLSQREIAEVLGIDFTAVSKTLKRAKENLKKRFDSDF